MDGYLSQVALFRTLPATELKRLSEVCELRRFQKGEVVFEEGQPAESVWLIQHGWVYLVRRTPAGTPVTIFTVTPEEMLCGFSAVVAQERYYASAVAATQTTAVRVPQADFARLLTHQPGFAERILGIYHTRMRQLAEAISLAHAPVEQRITHTLLRLRATFGNAVPIIHQELARMAGTRIETSIRAVADLKRRGWLSTSRGKMVILHPEKLRASLKAFAQSDGAGPKRRR